jgi:hypothetical protein
MPLTFRYVSSAEVYEANGGSDAHDDDNDLTIDESIFTPKKHSVGHSQVA